MSASDSSPITTPSWTNTELVHTSLPVLRHAWFEAAEMARDAGVPGLQSIAEGRITRVAAEEISDEPTLITIVDECQAMVAVVASDQVADRIGRMMRRGVYEYLLSIDARSHMQAVAETEAVIDPPVENLVFAPVGIDTVRSVVADHLSAGRYADCAALLARVTRMQRGADLAEVACAAGRACRAAGERRAAAQCFQASCAADPEYEGSSRIGTPPRSEA